LRTRLADALAARGAHVFFPDPRFCTDNGAMIAMAGALRLADTTSGANAFSVRPRWPLQ
jgi:N6-L-threonylcarbamoyladenine synthase